MRTLRRGIPLLLPIACAVVWSLEPALKAQNDEPWAAPYPLLMTYEHAAALADAAVRGLDYVPGEVLIKFKDGVGPDGQRRALEALRSRPLPSQLKWQDGLALLNDQLQGDSRILVDQLREQPEIEYVEPNYLYRFNTTPNDPSFDSRQWNLTALDLPRAWDINGGATSSITVAVLDSGITGVNESFVFPTWDGRAIRNVSIPFAVNPDLQASRLTGARDFVFWSGPVLDMDGHGTHVSSTIGEDTNNGVGLAGIAYNAKIMPVKVCASYWDVQFAFSAAGFRGFAPLNVDFCDASAMVQGIRYAADNGANVINLSVGGLHASQTVRDALTYALSKGVFISIAMGNEFEDGNPVGYPAAFAESLDGAMAVGAVGPSLARAYYSSTGSHIEIAAPGGNMRERGAADGIWQSTISAEDSDPATVIFPRFDHYVERPLQGTSMAAPHVAGIAALIISQGITRPDAVEALIKATAKDLGSSGRDADYGFGLIQPRRALFGFGILR